jgi:hypothetical protein
MGLVLDDVISNDYLEILLHATKTPPMFDSGCSRFRERNGWGVEYGILFGKEFLKKGGRTEISI